MDINAACVNTIEDQPNEDAVSVLSGRSGRLRDQTDEH